MRLLAGAAALLLLLSGCLAGSADKYFPPASDLPDGLRPIATDSAEWKVVAPYLGMQGNPGRITALDRVPGHDLGRVASVDAYLLQGNGTAAYGVMVVRFNGTADVGPFLAAGQASACDGKDLAHILRDGTVFVFIGGDGSTGRGRQVLGDLASAVQARSGATVVC